MKDLKNKAKSGDHFLTMNMTKIEWVPISSMFGNATLFIVIGNEKKDFSRKPFSFAMKNNIYRLREG